MMNNLYKKIICFHWLSVTRFTEDVKNTKQPTPKILFKYLSFRNTLIFTMNKKFKKLNPRQKRMKVFTFRNAMHYYIQKYYKQNIIC